MTDIFRDKAEMPMSGDAQVVRTMMVPAECHDKTLSIPNLRVAEPMDVRHVERPRFGHKV